MFTKLLKLLIISILVGLLQTAFAQSSDFENSNYLQKGLYSTFFVSLTTGWIVLGLFKKLIMQV